MAEVLLIETDARGVATVTLNRPEKHNALSAELIGALDKAAASIGEDDAIRVVVLTGEGRSFCAGGDLGWMRDQIAAGPEQRRAEAEKLANMLGKWNALPKPVIARVNGNAFGGGVGLACVADIAFSVDHASFGLTETRLGLIPATIGPYVIARLGEAMARRVFMSSRVFKADEALELGVIAKSLPSEGLDNAVEAEIAAYLACAPGAVTAAKDLALGLGAAPGPDEVSASIDALIERWEHSETSEGIDAFFDKRKAAWMV